MNYRLDLARVIRRCVEPAARDVDDRGSFPREAVAQLGRSGLLGLTVPASSGGLGQGLAEAVHLVNQLARVCGSTAAVVHGHFAAVAVLVEHGPGHVLGEIAAGRHLSALALAEPDQQHVAVSGQVPHAHGGVVDLRGRKNWVTAAGDADSYVWSSAALGPPGVATLWFVPAQAPGLHIPEEKEGVGLRGSATSTITADPVRVPESAMLGSDGGGTRAVMTTAWPWLLALGAAVSLGLAEAILERSVACVNGPQPSWTRWQRPPSRQPEVRADLARMRVRTRGVRLLLDDAVQATTWLHPDAEPRLLEAKAAASETAVQVAELGMKVCGQFAFRKELGIERRFRDAHAAGHGQLVTDAVLDSIGRALCDIPMLERE